MGRQDKINRIMEIFRWHREDMKAYQLLDELCDNYSTELDDWSDKNIDEGYEDIKQDFFDKHELQEQETN
jgi:hypothetical protein